MPGYWSEKISLTKANAFVRLWTLTKVPLLGAITPTLIELSDERAVLKVPLNLITRNHLGVMYFGALTMGAETSVGIKAMHAIVQRKLKVDLIFKDFQANFLKRADGDVHFICEQGQGVTALLEKAAQSGERETQTFHSYAIVPSKDPNVKVAEFQITLSLKRRKSL